MELETSYQYVKQQDEERVDGSQGEGGREKVGSYG